MTFVGSFGGFRLADASKTILIRRQMTWHMTHGPSSSLAREAWTRHASGCCLSTNSHVFTQVTGESQCRPVCAAAICCFAARLALRAAVPCRPHSRASQPCLTDVSHSRASQPCFTAHSRAVLGEFFLYFDVLTCAVYVRTYVHAYVHILETHTYYHRTET